MIGAATVEWESRSDEELALMAAEGSQGAMAVLYTRYRPKILTYVLGDEDLAQDVFLRALESIRQWRPIAEFGAWLYRIARNLRIDRARRRNRQPDLEPHTYGDGSPKNEASAACPGYRATEAMLEAERVLSYLPAHYVEALLIEHEATDLVTAARDLGLSEGALKSLRHRARSRIQERFGSLAEVAP